MSGLSMFIQWCKSVGHEPFPLTVDLVYAYVKNCREERAPATRAVEVIKGLRLATHTLELHNSTDIFQTARIQGCIKRSYQRKRLTKKATVLKNNAVAVLEKVVCESKSNMARVIAGFLRFCIGSRCRVGDATRIAQEPTLDLNEKTGRGYIDVTAHITKRSQVRLETSRMGVEITSHTWGLCHDNWAQKWLEARRDAGLNAVGDGTLMPSVGPEGFIHGVRMQTDEVAIHLREILIEWGIPIDEAALYTSHSLKATILSWCAKMGVPFKARRMLGYHAKSSEKSTLCYSRDAMAWPLRHLGKALQLIADGFFDPDTTRSGTWAEQDDSTAANAFGEAIKRVAREVADDDPVRYTGATIIGQAFEQQWLDLDHKKSALQQAQFVTGDSTKRTQTEESLPRLHDLGLKGPAGTGRRRGVVTKAQLQSRWTKMRFHWMSQSTRCQMNR